MGDGYAGTVQGTPYRWEWRRVPDSNHKLRRTARKHAKDLNRKYGAKYQEAKSKRGPFGWHVEERVRVPMQVYR